MGRDYNGVGESVKNNLYTKILKYNYDAEFTLKVFLHHFLYSGNKILKIQFYSKIAYRAFFEDLQNKKNYYKIK